MLIEQSIILLQIIFIDIVMAADNAIIIGYGVFYSLFFFN